MNTSNKPYSPEELYPLAQSILSKWKNEGREVPARWREDVIAEGVLGAVEVVGRVRRAVRAAQYERMRGAMLDFLDREIAAEHRAPPGSLPDAKRISLDMVVPGQEGEITTLAETIIDHDCPDPSAGLMDEERRQDVAQAMARLRPEEREAAQRVFIDGQTQEGAADDMAMSRDEIRTCLKNAKMVLRIWLSGYRDDVRFATRKKSKKKHRGLPQKSVQVR